MAKVGFIGAGKMAQALTKGLISAGLTHPGHVIVSCPLSDQHLLDEFKKMGCDGTCDNSDVVQQSDVVIIATKPCTVPTVLSQVSPVTGPQHLFISIALGITIHHLEKLLPRRTRVVRVMPNTPCLVRAGCSVFSPGSSATAQDAELTRRLFSAVGICEQVPESLVDAVTGLSGSGPAYMYMAIEAMADGGVKMGIPRDLAYTLAAQSCLGAATMVLETGRHPGKLKDDVCSPGGSTLSAVHLLEKYGLRSSLISAVEAAAEKSKLIADRQESQDAPSKK